MRDKDIDVNKPFPKPDRDKMPWVSMIIEVLLAIFELLWNIIRIIVVVVVGIIVVFLALLGLG